MGHDGGTENGKNTDGDDNDDDDRRLLAALVNAGDLDTG